MSNQNEKHVQKKKLVKRIRIYIYYIYNKRVLFLEAI